MGKILLKFLITAYAITTALLLLLALFVYKCYLPDKAVNACIIVIYILSTFLAGFLSGKRIGSQKYLWGTDARSRQTACRRPGHRCRLYPGNRYV